MRKHLEEKSKEELIDMVLHYRAKYEIEKLESGWLDELADALRDGEDEPDRPSDEIRETKESYRPHILTDTWKV
jgi:hypothetical protein